MSASSECRYSVNDLLQLRRDDVKVFRRARKAIFSLRLWCPRRMREQRIDLIDGSALSSPLIVTSTKSVQMTSFQCSQSGQCIWSPSIALGHTPSSSSHSSSPSPSRPQHPMTSSQRSQSRQCIWSPSTALECLSSPSNSSPSPSLSRPQHLMTSCQRSQSTQIGTNTGDDKLEFAIPCIIGHRPVVVTRRDDHRVCVLRPIRRSTLTMPVNIGVFNARSVHNKTAVICDWISSTKLKLAAVVETWHDSRDCPDIIACAPPDSTTSNVLDYDQKPVTSANTVIMVVSACFITAHCMRSVLCSSITSHSSTSPSTSQVCQ